MTLSWCRNSGVDQRLRDAGRRADVLCGAETHVCISQTALDFQRCGIGHT
ncbi:MAG: isochorismatase family protein [Armatimonadota bacterium]